MQTTRSQTVVTFDAAMALIQAAISHARDNEWAVAAAVLDPAGNVVASGRMDGVPAAVMEFATDKAYTALLGRSTQGFFERMSSSPELKLGLANRPRLCVWDGGEPILADGVLVGGLGVSGAAGPDDVKCAKSALAALGFDT